MYILFERKVYESYFYAVRCLGIPSGRCNGHLNVLKKVSHCFLSRHVPMLQWTVHSEGNIGFS